MQVVLTREEVAKLLPLIEGKSGLVVGLLYGSGLRITEAVRLRVGDLDYGFRQVTVRTGKGGSDRVTTFPNRIGGTLKAHLVKVRMLHERDLALVIVSVTARAWLTPRVPHRRLIAAGRRSYAFGLRILFALPPAAVRSSRGRTGRVAAP